MTTKKRTIHGSIELDVPDWVQQWACEKVEDITPESFLQEIINTTGIAAKLEAKYLTADPPRSFADTPDFLWQVISLVARVPSNAELEKESQLKH